MSSEKISVEQIKSYLLDLQNRLCLFLNNEDDALQLTEDQWRYADGEGGGITRAFAEGAVIEKAGVNFSHIIGKALPPAATLKRPELANAHFQALGVSTVIHPRNPYVPTVHMNVRFFVAETQQGVQQWWFGGGFDLTPYYGFVKDVQHWHATAKSACDPFGTDVYPRFKKWCDEYFYLKHRQEPRGVGGLFFDDLHEWGFERSFAFMRSVGDSFLKGYQPIVTAHKDHAFGEKERAFQLYRRGRYVEFNLLYDRGTLFGLQSGGRTESILISLPPTVNWVYNYQPAENSEEERLYKEFLVRKDWI